MLTVIHDDLRETGELRDLLESRFANGLTITKSKPYFVEITAQGVTKEQALAEVTARMGIHREEVIGIGDGQNDLTMTQWAGPGAAMGNAASDIQAAADYVTVPCDDCTGDREICFAKEVKAWR